MRNTAALDEGISVALRQAAPIALDAELSCRAGEVLALVGPSGAGKSTILRAIAGLYRPQAGRIACGGDVWFDSAGGIFVPPHRRAVGMVFQSYALFPHMTALGNVETALRDHPRGERERRARALLDLMHLSGLDGRRPAELSGGQQQRVAVARALAREPSVLLLDEPFSAVDKATRRRLYRELADLRRTLAIPIVLVTHDFDEAARLADRMCLLNHGRVVQTGAPHAILTRPATIEAARLVDLKNLFDGEVLDHKDGVTRIGWAGHVLIAAPARPDLAPGSRIAWTVPSTQAILIRDSVDASGQGNALSGVITEVVVLSEATSVIIAVNGRPEHALSVTVPADFDAQAPLAPGLAVAVVVKPEGIHLIASTG